VAGTIDYTARINRIELNFTPAAHAPFQLS
jgi:hypothetical protein